MHKKILRFDDQGVYNLETRNDICIPTYKKET